MLCLPAHPGTAPKLLAQVGALAGAGGKGVGLDERERLLPLAGKARAGEPFFALGRCLSATAALPCFWQVAPQKNEPESFCKLCTQLTAIHMYACASEQS